MRRLFHLPGLLAMGFAVTGCMMETGTVEEVPPPSRAVTAAAPVVQPLTPVLDPATLAHYAALPDGSRTVPAIDVTKYHPALLRNEVAFETAEAPGSVVIDTKGPFLYYIEGEGRATRYGIAVGREGFGWTGQGVIARSARWPTWAPPPEMIARDPSLERWREGQPGGVNNPLGARALYIYFDGHDSGYRIHGTNHPGSIGYAASSGCFRMLNQDVIELQSRVQPGAHVVVM